jgi:hypothetical protein
MLGAGWRYQLGDEMDQKKLMAHRFEVSRALRAAHHLTKDEMLDPGQAIHDLAAAVVAIATAIDRMLEAYEIERAEAS